MLIRCAPVGNAALEVATALDSYDRLARTTADADAILTNGGTAGVDVLRKLDELGDADLEEAALQIANGGEDALEGAAKLSDEGFNAVMRADTPNSAKSRTFRYYNSIEEGQNLFDSFLTDNDLRPQWIRVLNDPDISPESAQRTLQRISKELNSGASMKVEEFVTGRELNNQFPDNFEDPFIPKSIVTRFTTTGDERFVRVHVDGNQKGTFLVRQSDIEGLSPAEVENKLSLSYQPEYISDVTVPQGVRVNMGSVKSNFGGDSGAKQFNLGREIDNRFYSNKRSIRE